MSSAGKTFLKNNTTPVFIPFGAHGIDIFGGPFMVFRGAPNGVATRAFYVNMAREIHDPSHIKIPVEDFSVPIGNIDHELLCVILAGLSGLPIYAGCMGGIGRTGLLIGLLYKVSVELTPPTFLGFGGDPVLLTREHYKTHAIETPEQVAFIHAYDVSAVVIAIRHVLAALSDEVVVIPTTNEPELAQSATLYTRVANWVKTLLA